MSRPEVMVYGFETSNNMKVRIALGFHRIDYEFQTIDPADRTKIVALSGQHLTPVMQHGDRVLFDSAAILRYVAANFPNAAGSGCLFGTDRDQQWAIEDWELFARAELAGPMMEIVHTRVSGGEVSDAMGGRCQRAFDAAIAKLQEALGSGPWLVGDAMTAADITAAAVVHRVQQASLFEVDAGAELSGWVRRVMAFDGVSRVDANG